MGKRLFLFILIFSFLSCASIISDKHYPVSIDSNPPGAKVEVKDESGIIKFQGTTPATASLPAGDAYFDSHDYQVNISKDGYNSQTENITSSVDGWYWGNILLGGVIGLLIVDPITGSMYEIDQSSVTANLTPASVSHFEASKQSFDNTYPASYTRNYVDVDDAADDSSLRHKLQVLKELVDSGAISQQDYETKKNQLLSDF